MNALTSFAPGLAVRIFLYSIGNISPKAEWALIGLWDGYAVRKMSRRTASHETTAIYALLFLVDYYISHSFYKTAIISLWTVLGMIVTELLGPSHWHDTTSERRRGRRRSTNPVIPSQPIRAPPARQPRSINQPESARRIIEEQTAVTFAAPSTTSLSSDMSSLASSGSATSRENIWDSVRAAASAQPNSSNETTHRATMHPSNSTSRDPYDAHLPSPPDTFHQQTPLFGEGRTDGRRAGIAGNVPGGFTSRDMTTSPSPTPRNSPPPLMVPYVNIDPPASQGLLSSDSEPTIPPNLLSPLDIIEPGVTPQSEEYKIVPPRRSTPMPVVREAEEPLVASTSRVVKAEAEDDPRLTSSEEDSASDVPNDRASMLKAAERYRQQAKGFDNDVKKLKTERKTAEDGNKKRQSVALKSRMGTTEEQATKYHLKADSLFVRVDNPASKPSILDLKRVITIKSALQALKERLPIFLDSNEASLTIRLGTRVRDHEVRQAIFAYLSEGNIPHRSNDPSVILVTQIPE